MPHIGSWILDLGSQGLGIKILASRSCHNHGPERHFLHNQTFALGETANLTATIPVPHEGPAGVYIVRAAANEILGELPVNSTAFSIAIPDAGNGVEEACVEPGNCVLQC
ncbi:hypothetical protein QBC44DRAFT_371222 [Cladorrhinum sp. PSN332]|nr:hypothetical protein QBC44DRAFT_371222 [Cladorrhinum sp. PSN332]